MFKKLFVMLGSIGRQPKADLKIHKVIQPTNFETLPTNLNDLNESYTELIRELAKR